VLPYRLAMLVRAFNDFGMLFDEVGFDILLFVMLTFAIVTDGGLRWNLVEAVEGVGMEDEFPAVV